MLTSELFETIYSQVEDIKEEAANESIKSAQCLNIQTRIYGKIPTSELEPLSILAINLFRTKIQETFKEDSSSLNIALIIFGKSKLFFFSKKFEKKIITYFNLLSQISPPALDPKFIKV